MSIIRSEKDPRDADAAAFDEAIDQATRDINNDSNELYQIMETVLNNLDDTELLMLGGDKESFCEMYMIKVKAEILDVATDLAKEIRE